MKLRNGGARGGGQGLFGADGIARRQPLPGKEGLPGQLRDAFRSPAALALFGQHDRQFGLHVGVVEHRLADHAREVLEAFDELGAVDIGQVELVGGVRRAGLGVGVAAEGGAQPLPRGDRLGLAEILAFAKQQVFEQVRIALFEIAFVQRARIDPHPDRDLARRHPVLAHRVAQAVFHLAEQPLRIDRDIAALVKPGGLPALLQGGGFGDEQIAFDRRSGFVRGSGRFLCKRRKGQRKGRGNEGEGDQGPVKKSHDDRHIGGKGMKR